MSHFSSLTGAWVASTPDECRIGDRPHERVGPRALAIVEELLGNVFDRQAGRYLVMGLRNEEPKVYKKIVRQSAEFTPSWLRAVGTR